MLVLSRSLGQTICITDHNVTVKVTVIGNKNGSVRLGVEAPKEILIRRAELREQEQEDGRDE